MRVASQAVALLRRRKGRPAASAPGLPFRRLTVGIGPEDREAADLLVAAGIIHLVEFVPRPEFGADRVPQELHQLDPLDGAHAARAAHIKIKVLAQFWVEKIASVRIE